jgi:hypothetical protein
MRKIDDSVINAAEERLRVVLGEVAMIYDACQQLEHHVVHLAHELGMTWARIGEAHDPPISRERATKRYSHPKPRRTSKT